MVSIVGTQSGRLTEAFFDENGNEIGHYRLEKDYNPETGGSPFGFDKIHFISDKKEVSGEAKTKSSLYSYDSPEFSDIKDLEYVYQDISVSNEVAKLSSKDLLILFYQILRLEEYLGFKINLQVKYIL